MCKAQHVIYETMHVGVSIAKKTVFILTFRRDKIHGKGENSFIFMFATWNLIYFGLNLNSTEEHNILAILHQAIMREANPQIIKTFFLFCENTLQNFWVWFIFDTASYFLNSELFLKNRNFKVYYQPNHIYIS